MIGPIDAEANRMIPSAFHVPPRPFSASVISMGFPPLTSMRFSFSSAKKPSVRPSGDQNG